MTRRIGQHENETAMEYLRRAVSNLDYEPESLLDDLPSIEAIMDYFDLWTVYGTDFLQGIEECIEEGADPMPLIRFIRKYELKGWSTAAIRKMAKEAQQHGNTGA